MRLAIHARNRSIGIEDGIVVPAEGRFDAELHFPAGEVRPGLINAHDHLHRNHYGRLGGPRYRNAYQWARDIQSRYQRRIARGRRMPRRAALLAGAWKNLFAGVTHVVHHDRWEADFERDFPVRVVRVPSADSIGLSPGLETLGEGAPFCLHVAEGVDAEAAEEIRTLDRRGVLGTDLVAVHGVGADEDGVERMRKAGAALVWCPTSNDFLFGTTAPRALLAEGVDVLLGSDSLLTGAGDLLDELRAARAHGGIEDARLEAGVNGLAARRLGVTAPSLEPGAPADLIVLEKPLLEACARDVALVVAGGMPRVARSKVAAQLGSMAAEGRERKVGSVVRWTSTRGEARKGRQQ